MKINKPINHTLLIATVFLSACSGGSSIDGTYVSTDTANEKIVVKGDSAILTTSNGTSKSYKITSSGPNGFELKSVTDPKESIGLNYQEPTKTWLCPSCQPDLSVSWEKK